MLRRRAGSRAAPTPRSARHRGSGGARPRRRSTARRVSAPRAAQQAALDVRVQPGAEHRACTRAAASRRSTASPRAAGRCRARRRRSRRMTFGQLHIAWTPARTSASSSAGDSVGCAIIGCWKYCVEIVADQGAVAQRARVVLRARQRRQEEEGRDVGADGDQIARRLGADAAVVAAEADDVAALDRCADAVPGAGPPSGSARSGAAARPSRRRAALAWTSARSRFTPLRISLQHGVVGALEADVHVGDAGGLAEAQELRRALAARRVFARVAGRLDVEDRRKRERAASSPRAAASRSSSSRWRGLRTKLSSVKLKARTPSRCTRSIIHATSRSGSRLRTVRPKTFLIDAEACTGRDSRASRR